MTSRDRVMRAFRHEEPDRTPFFEYVLLSQSVWRTFLRRLPVHTDWARAVDERGWEGAVRQMAFDCLDLAARFEHDLIYIWPKAGDRPQPR